MVDNKFEINKRLQCRIAENENPEIAVERRTAGSETKSDHAGRDRQNQRTWDETLKPDRRRSVAVD
jgi:hypothetical protein